MLSETNPVGHRHSRHIQNLGQLVAIGAEPAVESHEVDLVETKELGHQLGESCQKRLRRRLVAGQQIRDSLLTPAVATKDDPAA